MAGGIDWFRWHHGTVTDQKFPLIARRSGASVAEVIAVWACLLEAASQNDEQRGMLASLPDFEAMDCALGMPDGRSEAIYREMLARTLVDDDLQVTAWPRRQPKRERPDDTSTERSRAFRERQRHATPDEDQATPRNATVGQETPRGEESREENTPPDGGVSAGKPARPTHGTRLPVDWTLPKAMGDWALSEYPHWTADTVRRIARSFADHWHSKPGKEARKVDWAATWRNWCSSGITQRDYPPPQAERVREGEATVPSREADRTAAYLAQQALSPEQKASAREAARALRQKAAA